MRKNIIVDLTIAVLRQTLMRLELWRRGRVRANPLLTREDARRYLDEIGEQYHDHENGDIITSPMEGEERCTRED